MRGSWIVCLVACARMQPMGAYTLDVVHDPLSLNPWIPWFKIAAHVCGVRHGDGMGPSVDLRECSVALAFGRAETWREVIEPCHFVPVNPAWRLPCKINLICLTDDAVFALEELWHSAKAFAVDRRAHIGVRRVVLPGGELVPFALLHDLASALFGSVQIDGLVNENSPGPCVVHGNDGIPDHSAINRDVIMLEVAVLPVFMGDNGPPWLDCGLWTFESLFGPSGCPLFKCFRGEATTMFVDWICRLV